MKTRIAFPIALLAALPGAVLAHPSAAGTDLSAGWLHPFTGQDHLLFAAIAGALLASAGRTRARTAFAAIAVAFLVVVAATDVPAAWLAGFVLATLASCAAAAIVVRLAPGWFAARRRCEKPADGLPEPQRRSLVVGSRESSPS